MRTALLTVLGLFLVMESAHAECVGFDICTRFKHSGSVFVADVRDIARVKTVAGWFNDVTFDVVEPLKNMKRGVSTLRMRLSVEGHDFREGERVVVLTTRDTDGSWSNFCTGTRAIREDDPDLRIARVLARGEDGASIGGRLVSVDNGRLIWTREHPDVRVTLRRTSGATSVVSTNRQGVFLFDWVRPGDYYVSVENQRGYPRLRQRVVVGTGQSCLSLPLFEIPVRR